MIVECFSLHMLISSIVYKLQDFRFRQVNCQVFGIVATGLLIRRRIQKVFYSVMSVGIMHFDQGITDHAEGVFFLAHIGTSQLRRNI